MVEEKDQEMDKSLEEALWQVEEAKKLNLSIVNAMNFINLSKEAVSFGNKRLAKGMVVKAKEQLFKDLVSSMSQKIEETKDVVQKMRLERKINEARQKFNRGDVKGSYDLLTREPEDSGRPDQITQEKEDMIPQLYSDALDSLQKVWLKMKQEENKGKDMTQAKELVKEAKRVLSRGDHKKVLELCQEVMGSIQSPKDRLNEEVDETIEEITKTLKALFPDMPRSPKERFFKKQIEDLLTLAKQNLSMDRSSEAVNNSRKAREILKKLEQETIKGDIPKIIIELRSSIDEIRTRGVDVSYEEYLLKQVEENFWQGEYIKSRKIANKLHSITENANVHLTINQLTSRLKELDEKLKERSGKEGYLEAKEFIDKAKKLMEQSAFDMVGDYLDKAKEALKT